MKPHRAAKPPPLGPRASRPLRAAAAPSEKSCEDGMSANSAPDARGPGFGASPQ